MVKVAREGGMGKVLGRLELGLYACERGISGI